MLCCERRLCKAIYLSIYIYISTFGFRFFFFQFIRWFYFWYFHVADRYDMHDWFIHTRLRLIFAYDFNTDTTSNQSRCIYLFIYSILYISSMFHLLPPHTHTLISHLHRVEEDSRRSYLSVHIVLSIIFYYPPPPVSSTLASHHHRPPPHTVRTQKKSVIAKKDSFTVFQHHHHHHYQWQEQYEE